MLNLLIPNRGVIPADFPGPHGICQNLNCQAVVERPFRFVKLRIPGGMLQTILCAACMPEPCAGTFPEMSLTVVTADPILPSPGGDSDSHVPRFRLVPVSELPVRPRPSPPPELIAKRTRTGPLTFEELCEMEPRLQLLLAEAEAHHKNREPVFCANAVWYGYPGFRPGIKDRLCKLAGWLAERAGDLNSPEAYDLAYQTLYSALPDCRGRCICTRILEI